MFKVSEYQKYNFGFPAHDIDPKKKKEKEYCLAFAKAFYNLWLRNEFWATPYHERDEIFQLRKYAIGDQAKDIYFELCYGKNEQGEIIRKGWMNVNWNILKIAVKYRNAFIGMFSDIDFDINCEALDRTSRLEKEEKAYRLYLQKKLKPILIQASLDPGQSEIPEPESLEEVKIYEAMGFFKNQAELAFEQFIQASFETISNWDLDIKQKLLEDFWDIGRVGCRDYVDLITQKVKVQYCDPANMIIRLDSDGMVLDGGEIKIMSIADLRAESGFTEDELLQCAQMYVGYFGNPDQWNQNITREEALKGDNYGRHWYDNFRIAVLKCEYRTCDTQYFTKKIKDDNELYFKERYGKEYKNSKNKETIKKDKINYYRASWVIGSEDMVYDYGEQYDIPRPAKSEARSSFHYYRIPGPSPVKICREVFDQAQLAWLKFQNAWAKARPDGYAYDESVLINAIIGSKITPDQIVKISEQTGRLFFRSTNKRNHPSIAPNAGHPIFPMPGGIGNSMNEFIATWNLMIGMLQELTGMSAQATASALAPDTGKAVSEIQLAATSNVLKPAITGLKVIKQSLAKNLFLRGQIVFRHNEEIAKDYYDILGETTVEIIKACSKSAIQMGINLVPRTNGEIKQQLISASVDAMQAGRNGLPGLEYPEYIRVLMMVHNNVNPRYIEGFMAKIINERRKKIEEDKQALVMSQSEGQTKQVMVAAEADKMKKQNDTNEEIRKETAKAVLEMAKIQFEKTIGAESEMTVQTMGVLLQELLAPYMQQQITQPHEALAGGQISIPEQGF